MFMVFNIIAVIVIIVISVIVTSISNKVSAEMGVGPKTISMVLDGFGAFMIKICLEWEYPSFR